VVSAAEAGLLALIEPILNPVWVFIVTHEQPSVPTLVGGLLLLSGVATRYVVIPRRADFTSAG
jgi:drug/metabolite transporter (DMT)-like permease